MSDTPHAETADRSGSDAPNCSPSFSSETDVLYDSDLPKWDDDDYVPVQVYLRMRDHARMLENQRDKARRGHSSCCGVRDSWRAEALRLREAAQAVIDRWDTPLWKDAPATAGFIEKLRKAISSENDKDLARRALDSE